MKTDISNKNTCSDLNRTKITSSLSQISISITEKIQNVILKTSDQLKAGNIKEAENILQAHDFIKKLVINSNEVITACKDRLAECLIVGSTDYAERIVSFMKVQGMKGAKIRNTLVTACKDSLVKCLSNGWIDDAERIVSFMKEQGIIKEKIVEVLKPKEIRDIVTACKDRLAECLIMGHTGGAERIVSLMKEQGIEEVTIRNTLVTVCKDGLVKCLNKCWIVYVEEIVSFMKRQGIIKEKITELFNSEVNYKEKVVTACKDGLVECLSNGEIRDAKGFVSFMKEQGIIKEKISEIFNSKEIKEIVTACKDGLVKCLSKGWIGYAKDIVSFMKEQGIIKEKIAEVFNSEVNPKEIGDIATTCKNVLFSCLRNGWTDDAKCIVSFMKEQGINEEEIIKKSEIIKVLMHNLNCKIIEDLFEYDREFLSYVIKNYINEFSFPDNIINDNLIKKYGLYSFYKEFNERGNFDFYIDKKLLYEILKKHDKRWQDETNINKPFEKGAKEFGIDNMFIYLSGRNVDLHDALYNFNKICNLFKKSKIDNNAFFNKILRQVRDDNGTYNEGSAYDHLNSIANTLCEVNIEEIFQKVEKLKGTLPEIDELLKVYEKMSAMYFHHGRT